MTNRTDCVTVKAFFNGELRRFPFSESSFSKFVAQLKELFSLQNEILVSYKDDEGDKITMSSDLELKEALKLSTDGILRVKLALPQQAGIAVQQPELVEREAGNARRVPWEEKQRKREMKQELKAKKEELKADRKIQREAYCETKREMKRNVRCGKEYAAGKFVARHVKDVTVVDGSEFTPGATFLKIWRIRNEGSVWPDGCSLLFVGRNSDHMGGPDFVALPGPVEPGNTVDVSVPLVAPAEPGRYVGYWRLRAPDGRKFGQRLWVSITVSAPASSSDEKDVKAV